MQKSTCKILIGLGLLWSIPFVAYMGYALLQSIKEGVSIGFAVSFMLPGFFVLMIPAWILFLIGILKWNSEEEKEQTLLSRAKVNINSTASINKIKSVKKKKPKKK